MEIREYDITIGDNPCCSEGPPLSLDWDYTTLPPQPFLNLEEKHDQKRSRQELLLDSFQRRNILYRIGYTLDEIQTATRKVDKDRKQRQLTNTFLCVYELFETIQDYTTTVLPSSFSSSSSYPKSNYQPTQQPTPPQKQQQPTTHRQKTPSIITLTHKQQQQQQHDSDSERNTHTMYSASQDSNYYPRYSIPVDRNQHDKAKQLVLCNLSRPHMRAFHLSWISFFVAFFTWFSITPLLGEIQESLHLTKQHIWTSSMTSSAGTMILRILVGPACDKWGARYCMAGLLILSAIPTAFTGCITTATGLIAIRACIGIAGGSFVACQYWTTSMFTREVAGTANALVASWGNLGGGMAQLVIGSIFFPLLKRIYTDTTTDTTTTTDITTDTATTMSSLFPPSTSSSPAEKAWRTVFIIPAILSFVTAWILLRYCEDSPKGDYQQRIRQQEMEVVHPTVALCKTIYKSNTWILLIQYGCCFGIEVTMTNATALYYKDQFNQSTVSAAAIASFFGSMNIFARGLGGYWSDYWNSKDDTIHGRLKLQGILLLLQGVTIIFFAISKSLLTSLGTLLLVSIFVQLSEGSTFAIVPYIDARYTGAVVGWVGAGGSVGGLLFSYYFYKFQYETAFLFMASTAIASSFLVCFMNRESLIFVQQEIKTFNQPTNSTIRNELPNNRNI